LKEFLGGRLFKSNEEVKDSVKQYLNGLEVVLLREFESGAQSDPLTKHATTVSLDQCPAFVFNASSF
jgi:hypothetical protein